MIIPLEDRISRYVGCLDPAVAGQHGHDTTLRMACVLVHGFALTEEQAWRLRWTITPSACHRGASATCGAN